jgi:ATP-dependent Clp protease ATP-binding subunit ClpC
MTDDQFDSVKKRVMDIVKDKLSPELLNRIDHKIIFKPFSKDLLRLVFVKEWETFLGQRKAAHPKLKLPRLTPTRIDAIIDEIYDPQYGARPVATYIHTKLEPEIIQTVMDQS